MSPDIDLRDRLANELHDLPHLPPESYLRQGRRARRRRHAAATAAIAAVSALAFQALAPSGGEGDRPIAKQATSAPDPGTDPGTDPEPDFVAPEPNNPVEAVEWSAVADDIDWFTTDDVPPWAREYGSHGPVHLRPDGRLWVAPDATVRRIVVDPYARGTDGVSVSYAIEAEYAGAPQEMPDDVVWVLVTAGGAGGAFDEPGRWTNDFELWVDDVTAASQGRPSFAERLVQFADERSDELVAGADGVEIVRQVRDPEVDPMWEPGTRAAAAEVRWAGTTWFVQAADPRQGGAWYIPYDGADYADFDAFLDELAGRR